VSRGANALLAAGEDTDESGEDTDAEGRECAQDVLDAIKDEDVEALHDALCTFIAHCGTAGVTIAIG